MGDMLGQQSLKLCNAVKEILLAIFERESLSSSSCLSVTIRSIKGRCSLVPRSWYNIKVLTSTNITEQIFTEGQTRSPELCRVLQYMQGEEEESHLCVQYVDTNSTVSANKTPIICINLLLHDNALQVCHQARKSTEREPHSIIYLRVHVDLCHIMSEGKKIQNMLMMLKTFAPKCNMTFTLKLGEALSVADMSISSWKTIPECEVSIVTGTAFLVGSSNQATSHSTCVPHVHQSGRPYSLKLSLDGASRDVQVHVWCVGQCVRLSGVTEQSSLVTLTVYGPGMVPSDIVSPDQVLLLLQRVNWRKHRIQLMDNSHKSADMFPHHASVKLQGSFKSGKLPPFILCLALVLNSQEVRATWGKTWPKTDTGPSLTPKQQPRSDYLWVNANISTLLQKLCQISVQCLENVVDKALQPVLNIRKNQSVVSKSIQSVCKAVVDIVSLSDNDDFRNSVIHSLQVQDTVDLAESLQRHLSDISRCAHQGIWQGDNSDILNKTTTSSEKPDRPERQSHVHNADERPRPGKFPRSNCSQSQAEFGARTTGGLGISFMAAHAEPEIKTSANFDEVNTFIDTTETNVTVPDLTTGRARQFHTINGTDDTHGGAYEIPASTIGRPNINRQGNDQLTQSPFHQLMDDMNEDPDTKEAGVQEMGSHTDQQMQSPFHQLIDDLNKLPNNKEAEVQEKSSHSDQLAQSPFHQLRDVVIEEPDNEAEVQEMSSDQINLNGEQLVPDSIIRYPCKKDSSKLAVSKELSPFYHLIDESDHQDDGNAIPLNHDEIIKSTAEIDQEKTPDMRYIIKHMKYVSPFHELTQAAEGEEKAEADFDTIIDSEEHLKGEMDNIEFIEDPYQHIMRHCNEKRKAFEGMTPTVTRNDQQTGDCVVEERINVSKIHSATDVTSERDDLVKEHSETALDTDDWFDNVLKDVADWL